MGNIDSVDTLEEFEAIGFSHFDVEFEPLKIAGEFDGTFGFLVEFGDAFLDNDDDENSGEPDEDDERRCPGCADDVFGEEKEGGEKGEAEEPDETEENQTQARGLGLFQEVALADEGGLGESGEFFRERRDFWGIFLGFYFDFFFEGEFFPAVEDF